MTEDDLIAKMRSVASAECKAASKMWSVGDAYGDWAVRPERPNSTVAERIKPFIGSGLTQNQVAELLGCTRGPIVKALKKMGAKL